MPFRRIALLLLLLSGCGSESQVDTPTSAPGPLRGLHGRGRQRPDRRLRLLRRHQRPRLGQPERLLRAPGLENLDVSAIQNSAWIGRIKDRFQVGFDLTDPRHLSPRPDPKTGRWVQAHSPQAVVARIRAGDYQAAGR